MPKEAPKPAVRDAVITSAYHKHLCNFTARQWEKLEERATELNLDKTELIRRIMDDYFDRRDLSALMRRLEDLEARMLEVEAKPATVMGPATSGI